MKNNNKMKIGLLVVIFLLLIFINSADFLLIEFGDINFAVVMYQINSPLVGTSHEVLWNYIWNGIGKSLLEICIIYVVMHVYYSLNRKMQFDLEIKWFGKWIKSIRLFNHVQWMNYFVVLFMIFLLGVSLQRAIIIGIPEYVKNITDVSTIYETEYVDPETVDMLFPDRKRNLIFIYLESMESTYASTDIGGGKLENYIPNLVELAQDNISFSNTNQFGGYSSYDGWTMGALLASTSGATYKLPIAGNSAGQYTDFLPGLTSMGDILEDAGYHNYFMCGSDAEFGGRKLYFEEHGNYEIFDYYAAIEDGLIAKDYLYFWGFEDQKLYQYAEDKLTNLAEIEEPFNFTLLTVDTHHPQGCVCDLCEAEYAEQFANIVSCADRQIGDFIRWIKEQKWYENTTVVVVGDHLSMNTTFWDDLPTGYERKVYNCFINSAVDAKDIKSKNRMFYSVDILPTTLSAIGVEIKGERLGLGTNAFSSVPTLPERMGEREYLNELAKYSRYYEDNFIKDIN